MKTKLKLNKKKFIPVSIPYVSNKDIDTKIFVIKCKKIEIKKVKFINF